ncbi:forkhead box protein J1-A-like isoform X1 [Scleropages formosus]|nr:forkhead box protein J1-A-like isoform X1 [Scleropages formosus]
MPSLTRYRISGDNAAERSPEPLLRSNALLATGVCAFILKLPAFRSRSSFFFIYIYNSAAVKRPTLWSSSPGDGEAIMSLSSADSWPEGSAGLEDESFARDSGATVCLDDSLTSLQWLQEFSISAGGGQVAPLSAQNQSYVGGHLRMAGPDAPASPMAADPASMGTPHTPSKPTSAAFCRGLSPSALPGPAAYGRCPEDVDYKSDPHVKPPYSYATLICMAMQASKKSKLTLSCIYKWIKENFCYFRHADPTWQNSIRHNLSLNKCFIKVPRQKDEPGKGGFWKIDPQYADRLLSGAYKKHRLPPVQINPVLQARVKPAPLALSGFFPAVGGQGTLSVSPESVQLLQDFEQATGADQNWDPSLSSAASRAGKRCSRKRKRTQDRGLKYFRRCSSPLLSGDEQEGLGPLKGDFDWNALLDPALTGELSLDGAGELSPIGHDEDLMVHGTRIGRPQQWSPLETSRDGEENHVLSQTQETSLDFDEETFLATAFLQNPWQEEDDDKREQNPQVDFLCSSAVNIEQLFDLSDDLSNNISSFF